MKENDTSIDVIAIATELFEMKAERKEPNVPYSKEDYAQRLAPFGCKETEIALTQDDLTDKICVLIGNFHGHFNDKNNKQEKMPTKLRVIGGDATFCTLQEIKDLGNLEVIIGNAYFQYSKIGDLRNLVRIWGNAHFEYSNIEDLKELEEIRGYANFEGSPVTGLGKLKKIMGSAYISSNQRALGEELNRRGINVHL